MPSTGNRCRCNRLFCAVIAKSAVLSAYGCARGHSRERGKRPFWITAPRLVDRGRRHDWGVAFALLAPRITRFESASAEFVPRALPDAEPQLPLSAAPCGWLAGTPGWKSIIAPGPGRAEQHDLAWLTVNQGCPGELRGASCARCPSCLRSPDA